MNPWHGLCVVGVTMSRKKIDEVGIAGYLCLCPAKHFHRLAECTMVSWYKPRLVLVLVLTSRDGLVHTCVGLAFSRCSSV
jgi:hypothetical protein